VKALKYINYFFYLAWNWNPILAFFIIYHEIRGEKEYQLHTTGFDELKSLEKQGTDISHATMYMPANYFMLEKMLGRITVNASNNCFIDIGCGKGRVMIVAAHYGFKKIAGVEFSKQFCAEATKLIKTKEKEFINTSFSVINRDAADFIIPDDATTIFLYNPFDAFIMKKVVKYIEESLLRVPRNMQVVYINPQEKYLFLRAGFTEVFHYKKLKYLEGSILKTRVTHLK
jgi:SAM-dependent methyltransferase